MPYFMRAIDRVHAERQLIKAFNKNMSFDDVALFFKRMRIRRPDFGDGSYSLTDLVRGYLADCSDEVLLEIAHQLGLDVAPEEGADGFVALGASKYWRIDHFRVFISHVHTAKLQAGGLRRLYKNMRFRRLSRTTTSIQAMSGERKFYAP
jgi:hypothetical protein